MGWDGMGWDGTGWDCPIPRGALVDTTAAVVSMNNRVEKVKLILLTVGLITISTLILVAIIVQSTSDRKFGSIQLQIAKEERDKDIFLATQHQLQKMLDEFIYKPEQPSGNPTHFNRAKILNIFVQLDGFWKGELIKLLYQEGYISTNNEYRLLQNANLDNIVFRPPMHGFILRNIDFRDASIRNGSFDRLSLVNADFSDCDLTGARFQHTLLVDTSFARTILHKADFTKAEVIQTTFTGADLTGATISDTILSTHNNVIDNVILPDGTFKTPKPPMNLIWNGDAEHPNGGGSTLDMWRHNGSNAISTERYGHNSSIGSNITVNRSKHGNFYFCTFTSTNEREEKVITMTQDHIDLADYRHLINANRAHFKFSAWLGGIGKFPDYAEAQLTFKISGIPRKTIHLGRVTAQDRENQSTLMERVHKDVIPRNSDSAEIQVNFHLFKNQNRTYGTAIADTFELFVSSA